jgi:hypothetical protein
VALVPAAHGTAATHDRPLTTTPNVFVDIQVTVTDERISLNRHSATRGDMGRFVIRNAGKKPHTFAIGHSVHGTGQNAQGTTSQYGKQSGFTTTVKPKEQKTFLLFLDFRGPVPYYSTTPTDRGKPGMKGTFTIH